MAIKIHKERLDLIGDYGEKSFPNECCGFLLGKLDGNDREIQSILPADNEFEDDEKYHRFLITPEAYRKAEKIARERGQDVLGFYHSHPNAPARPSQYDVDHAWPWYSYVIASVMAGKVAQTTSWILNEDRKAFGEEEIEIIHESLRANALGCFDIA